MAIEVPQPATGDGGSVTTPTDAAVDEDHRLPLAVLEVGQLGPLTFAVSAMARSFSPSEHRFQSCDRWKCPNALGWPPTRNVAEVRVSAWSSGLQS